MDIAGHLLVGVLVSGKLDAMTCIWSLAPDISALPFQVGDKWQRPYEHPRWLLVYKLTHALMPLLAYALSGVLAAVLVLAHVAADLCTHERPFGLFNFYAWRYGTTYYKLLTFLGALLCTRLFYFREGWIVF